MGKNRYRRVGIWCYLDLSKPINQESLKLLDWTAINRLRARREDKSSPLAAAQLFSAVACKPESCPIGWTECKGRGWQGCYFYELIKAVFAKEAIREKEERI